MNLIHSDYKGDAVMMISDSAKYKQLESIIKAGTGRELTEQEQSHIKWICGWDMDTFNVYKGILQDISKARTGQ